MTETAHVRTREITGRIVEPNAGVFSTSSPSHYIWFEVLEPGESHLRRVRISRRHSDPAIQEKLYSLSEDDVVSTVLVKASETDSWSVDALEIESRGGA